jgi:hypothetical protein
VKIALTPFVAGWTALACAVAGLAMYRRMIANREDGGLHVRESEVAEVSKQAAIAHRLDIVDWWGKVLTVILASFGVLLLALYLYQVWTGGMRM